MLSAASDGLDAPVIAGETCIPTDERLAQIIIPPTAFRPFHSNRFHHINSTPLRETCTTPRSRLTDEPNWSPNALALSTDPLHLKA